MGGGGDLSLLVSLIRNRSHVTRIPRTVQEGFRGYWPLFAEAGRIWHTGCFCWNRPPVKMKHAVEASALSLFIFYWRSVFSPAQLWLMGFVLCFCFSGPLWSTRSFWGCSGTGRSVSWWFRRFSHLVWLLDLNLSWI